MRQPILRIFSWGVWSRFPAPWQFVLSRLSARLCELRISRFFIWPYAILNYVDYVGYMLQFVPEGGASRYASFQDFFTRKLKHPRMMQADYVWPCDGLLCETGRVSELGPVNVKGRQHSVNAIFGRGFNIPQQSFFANVFLHNSDYHRIHAPVMGEIVNIVRIPGELRFLRPWLYMQPSLPAFTNERINVEISAKAPSGKTQSWFLSIVGGPGVATIELDEKVKVGSTVQVGQELALFRLGSTCCMVSPVMIDIYPGTKVLMGDLLNIGP